MKLFHANSPKAYSPHFPPAPPGRTGWPWTGDGTSSATAIPDNRPWPAISIVTPSYNQGEYLEATIRSVLLQGYPNLTYYVIDGGSTDGSIEILRKYHPWITGWVSEPDGGQSHAINKGFARATGEIFGWLNSDDLYEPDVLRFVGRTFADYPDLKLLYGKGWTVDEGGNKTGSCNWIVPFERRRYLRTNFILQPAAFWRRSLWQQIGGLDEKLHFTMDWDWLIRASAQTQPRYFPVYLASWREIPGTKTVSGGMRRRAEIAQVSRKYGGIWQATNLVFYLDWAAAWAAAHLGNGFAGQVVRWLTRPISWLLKSKLWGGQYQN